MSVRNSFCCRRLPGHHVPPTHLFGPAMKNPPSNEENVRPDADNAPAPHEADAQIPLMKMGEMYHRVSNSLNLISCKLQLQARQSGNPEVRRALDAAVDGINGLARIHGRLYGHHSHRESGAASYLEGLVRDLQAVLLGPARGRHLELAPVDAFVLGDDELTSLGSIVTELVINAIKYGAGAIAVEVQHLPGRLAIVVEDQGRGFPVDFNLDSDAGYGLRLVRHLCEKSAGLVSVDRSVPHGKVVALIGVRGGR
jgi:two-component sensor histidine kinase